MRGQLIPETASVASSSILKTRAHSLPASSSPCRIRSGMRRPDCILLRQDMSRGPSRRRRRHPTLLLGSLLPIRMMMLHRGGFRRQRLKVRRLRGRPLHRHAFRRWLRDSSQSAVLPLQSNSDGIGQYKTSFALPTLQGSAMKPH